MLSNILDINKTKQGSINHSEIIEKVNSEKTDYTNYLHTKNLKKIL